jgi:hypothetical protein
MRIFGWSYPPGAENDPNAPWNQVEGPCAVCGNVVDDCICPTCPTCTMQGDPSCYDPKHRLFHGLVRTEEQEYALMRNEAQWEEDARQESAAHYHPPEEEV